MHRLDQLDAISDDPIINLLRNPSCEGAVTADYVTRRNFAVNPLGSTAVDAGGYGFVNGSTATFDSTSKGVMVTAPAGGTTDSGLAIHNALDFSAGAGTYTLSVDVTGVVADGWRLSAQGAWVSSIVNSSYTTIGAGETKRIAVTFTAIGTTKGSLFLLRQTPALASQAIAKNVLFENVSQPLPFFDGATPNDGTDRRTSWTSAANASVSQMVVDVPVGFGAPAPSAGRVWGRSNQWASEGQYSVRVSPFGNNADSFAQLDQSTSGLPNTTNSRGRTFTISGVIRVPRVQVDGGDSRARRIIVNYNTPAGIVDARSPQAPNSPGVYRVSVTITLPTDLVGWNFVRLYNGDTGSAAQDVWWDELMLVEGYYSGPYVDGDDLDWRWDGSQDASSSRGYVPSPQRIRNRISGPNPQSTSGFPLGWGFPGAGGSGVGSVPSTADGPGGRFYARKTFDGVTNGTQNADLFSIANGTLSGTTIGGTCRVNYGTQYVMSIWVRSSITNVVRLQSQHLTFAGGAASTDGAQITLAAGVWTRLVLPFTPSTPATVATRLDIDNGATASGWTPWPAGSTFDVSSAMITEGTVVHDYCDGNTPSWRWENTPGNSTSVGYPYTLSSILGGIPFEIRDSVGSSQDVALSPYADRTVFSVFDVLVSPTTGFYAPIWDGLINQSYVGVQTDTLGRLQGRIDTHPTTGQGFNQIIFYSSTVVTAGRHMTALVLYEGMTKRLAQFDGTADTNPIATIPGNGLATGRLSLGTTAQANGVAIIRVMAELNRPTRDAVRSWIRNRYGLAA